ncbi:MAG: flagellar export protein FliJ [Burkholderiaceae bacterium]|nr:flagellar export protein FliJ [Burkholderiaceae bacterium]
MNSLQPVMTLLGQTERERDELAAGCQRAATAQRTAAAQLEQLVVYRREYEQRWANNFRTDGRMELVNCYRGFMERLTQAVEQQRRVTAQAEAELEQARLALRDSEIRVASVRKLIERRVADVRVAVDRREQKATDEFAARAAWNLQGAGGWAGAL